MRILLTGGTGFVGRHVLRELLAQGHQVRALIRRGGAPEGFEKQEVELIRGDINDPLEQFMKGVDGVIHLVGIIKESPSEKITFEALHTNATRNVVHAAEAAGVDRLVYVSANGASEHGETRYQTTKWAAEEAIRNSSLNHWSILGPGLIFGDPGMEREEICVVLANTLIKPFPVLPVFGNGQYQLQPVSVEEVAEATVQALTRTDVHGQTIPIVGRRRLSYVDFLDVITRALGLKPKPKVKLPLSFVRTGMRFAGKMLPITPDQFAMLIAGNVADETRFYDTFQVSERPFNEESLGYLRFRL
ncbi:MAG: NAD(P)H-binding protein [Bacteroidetes bacterium]|nr:NAD(P)H-binding protein [Bacteroidota bacterium]MCY4205301.1 NAD(P)H-binding protein [Bacteroidota bacterium]